MAHITHTLAGGKQFETFKVQGLLGNLKCLLTCSVVKLTSKISLRPLGFSHVGRFIVGLYNFFSLFQRFTLSRDEEGRNDRMGFSWS
jgi:hypothetical protein